MTRDISGTEGGQLISKSGESAVDGVNLFSFIALETIEFSLESVNPSIFLC